MYEHYVQATNIHCILMKCTAVSCLLSLQSLLYDYFHQSLLNFELHCQLKCLLLQYMIVFVSAFVFDVDFQ